MFQKSVYARNMVTAETVKTLRQKSGAPMMDCKKALMAHGINGDITLAMDWLRAKGIAKASGSERVSKEGLIAVRTHNNGAMTLLEINCETGVNNLFYLSSILTINFYRLFGFKQRFSKLCCCRRRISWRHAVSWSEISC